MGVVEYVWKDVFHWWIIAHGMGGYHYEKVSVS